MAHGHHPRSRPGTGRACLSPPVDCHDGRIVAYTAGSGPDADARRQDARQGRGDAAGGGEALGAFRPRPPLPVVRMAGAHGPLRPGAVTGAKGCSPDDAAAEGFFGRMKTESVYPGRWEERTCDEVLALVDDCIRWHDHERIKRSLGWMSPVQYRQSQGTAAWSPPKKRPQPPPIALYVRSYHLI